MACKQIEMTVVSKTNVLVLELLYDLCCNQGHLAECPAVMQHVDKYFAFLCFQSALGDKKSSQSAAVQPTCGECFLLRNTIHRKNNTSFTSSS